MKVTWVESVAADIWPYAHADRGSQAPDRPTARAAGRVLFSGASGETLYVGKARVLRDRVRSYLGAQGTEPAHRCAAARRPPALEVIVTDSVVEALALENRLIKQRNPRFNILLRDDKTYPYLQLTTTERAPRVLVARRVERDGNVYAGPFMPAALARRTMSLTHRLFGIRSCNEMIDGQRERPCLEYDIKRCIAPCVESICTIDRYQQAVEQARLLLEGRQEELVDQLQREMARRPPRRSSSSGPRTCATPSGPSRRCAIGSRRWRRRRSATATPSASRSAPAGAVVQVFQMRHGRVRRLGPSSSTDDGQPSGRGRGESATRPAGRAISRAESCGRASAVLRGPRSAAPRFTCRWRLTPRTGGARGLAVRSAPGAGSGSSCRSAAKSAACSSWRRATPPWPIRSHFGDGVDRRVRRARYPAGRS